MNTHAHRAHGGRVQRGITTAAEAAPARSVYSFSTKPLSAGTYVLRVFESSAEDGSTVAEQRLPVAVR